MNGARQLSATSMASSSFSSRMSAASGVSSSCTLPPGNSQSPAMGLPGGPARQKHAAVDIDQGHGGDQQAPARRAACSRRSSTRCEAPPRAGAGSSLCADKGEAQLLLHADRAAVGRHGGGLDTGQPQLLESHAAIKTLAASAAKPTPQ